MLKRAKEVEECDATKPTRITVAGNTKINLLFLRALHLNLVHAAIFVFTRLSASHKYSVIKL